MHKKWCWNPPHVEVTVKDADVSDVLFTHSGYYLKCSISHNITLVSHIYDVLCKMEYIERR